MNLNRKLPNLNATASSRSEAINWGVKGWTNHQLPLEESVQRFKSYTNEKLEQLITNEERNAPKTPRLTFVDAAVDAFQDIYDVYTWWALNKVEEEF